jgi:hypothetical protein
MGGGPMGMLLFLKMMGLVSFIITVLLLAISFFVLSTARKAEEQGLKVFGYVITILLWISAAILFSGVISAMTAKHNFRSNMGMRGLKAGRQQMMQKQMPKTQGQMMPMIPGQEPEKPEKGI